MEEQQIQPNTPNIEPPIPEAPQKSGMPTWAIVLITVLAIAVIGVGVYVAYQYYLDSQLEPAPRGDQQPTDPAADWQTYKNEEYGFSLKFSDTWDDHVATKRLLNWGNLGTSNSFDFGFEPQESLFNISIHSKEQWQGMTSQEGPGPQYINESSDYVFAYSIGHDLATSKGTMITREGIMQIISTFKFIP